MPSCRIINNGVMFLVPPSSNYRAQDLGLHRFDYCPQIGDHIRFKNFGDEYETKVINRTLDANLEGGVTVTLYVKDRYNTLWTTEEEYNNGRDSN